MAKDFYITTPLYYVNASPHIGHSYTEVAADAMARYMRLKGVDVYFMTGTDEHGQKIDQAAQAQGLQPKEFADKVMGRFTDLWKELSIGYDYFIRTTDKGHIDTVQKALEVLKEKGDLYVDEYKGWYCIPCETFWPKAQLESNLCPECNRPLEEITEENYFFKLSKYQGWLIDYIKKNPDFIQPSYRKNEVTSFLEQPLNDLCITRPKSRVSWGIEVPFSKDHVVYVWFDALLNYIAGCGWLSDKKKFKKFWPCDYHLIGKDILRPHAVYWPIMLHALGLKPPKTVFAHGWWTLGGEKISKSKGKVIDPVEVINEYGTDVYRYFLLREVKFGQDGVYSEEALIARLNSDLANDVGNLLNRTLTMIEKYNEGKIPAAKKPVDLDNALRKKAEAVAGKVDVFMGQLDFQAALDVILDVINLANKYIEETAPWTLRKEGKIDNIFTMLYHLTEVLRISAIGLYPVIPDAAEQIWSQLGMPGDIAKVNFKDFAKWGVAKPGTKIQKKEPLFPRRKP